MSPMSPNSVSHKCYPCKWDVSIFALVTCHHFLLCIMCVRQLANSIENRHCMIAQQLMLVTQATEAVLRF
ncbi:putative transcription factor C2H2 family [Medicago truncatula]|uniref:Putative transcription factor C2H2 family n=1 Tax=Medicago truncatula TaxID=3880 RepID=A0A396HTX0_MEDTR|nr:putative transcription factor C2H2 family [Medicago truncatula]